MRHQSRRALERAQPRRAATRPSYTLAPACLAAALLSACATAKLVPGNTLASYSALTTSDGIITKSKLHVTKERVLAAQTVKIVPTEFGSAAAPKLTAEQRAVVANVINRAVCIGLSDRFVMVSPDMPADLTVRAVITHATETNEIAAGVSVAATIGMKFVETPYPVPIPRVPIGLGDISVEAEAIDPQGQQVAAMLWGKGATMFFSKPRISKASDAYELSAAFAGDFSYLLIKGKSPFGGGVGGDLSLPSWDRIKSSMGLAPKYSVCDDFGRSPGVLGIIGGHVGLPHEWTDKGDKKAAE